MFLFTILSLINSPTVQNLVKDTYFTFTSNDDVIRVVHYTQMNCPACDEVEPVFVELSRMYWQEKRMQFAQFDCDRASDVCDSCGARDYPAWFVWFQGQSHPKRFNRNINVEQFTKFIRQGSGIRPTQNENNLLYVSPNEYSSLIKKSTCNFIIVDTPMDPQSQALHNASRNAELRVKRGAKFFAVDKNESPTAANHLIGQHYGAYFVKNNKWIQYNDDIDEDKIISFLRSQKCPLIISTPTPTPEPLPELEDVEDEPYPDSDSNSERRMNDQDDDEDDDEDSDDDLSDKKKDDFEDDDDFSFHDDDNEEFED